MQLTFLGTSAGTPTRKRNVTSMALSFADGRHWLFDCGEGTQHQILYTAIKPGKIDRIFLTHFHGDHWYGLFGLLTSMKIHGRVEPITLYSPPGLESVLKQVYGLSDSKLPFKIEFVEITGLHQLTTPEGFKITTVPIKHTVPSYAYCITEPDHIGAFDINKAKALGVDHPSDLQVLTRGEVLTKDNKEFNGKDFRLSPRPGLKIAILGDTSDASALKTHFMQPDWITHECTYDAARADKAVEYGHATTTIAATIAKDLQAKNLILTHFSPRYESGDELSIADLAQEAQAQLGSSDTKVHIAEDFKVFHLS